MATILNLRQFFKARPKPLTYKYRHFLNSVDEKKLEEILIYSEGEALATMMSPLQGKKVLFFNDQKHKFALKKLLQVEPARAVNLVYQGREPQKQKQGYWTFQGELANLPLRKGYFDYYVCPFVLSSDMRWLEKAVQNFAGHMANGQKMLIAVRHPGLEQILLNQNPATAVVSDLSLSRLFEVLKQNHLFTEALHEGCVDLSLKPYFSENDHDYYHEYKNTPLCAVISAVKFQRKN